jgi:hypothetical protein
VAVATMFAEIGHVAPSDSRRETSWISVCCLCGLIRDVTRCCLDGERWITRRTYRNTYGVNPSDGLLTHAYCPACFAHVMTQVRGDNETARAKAPRVGLNAFTKLPILIPYS